MKFCWATIAVKDMERSLDFYQNLIGLKLVRRANPSPTMELAFLGDGDTQVELVHNTAAGDIGYGQGISLGFVVDSLDTFSVTLRERGMEILAGPFQPTPAIRFLYVKDPDGLKIQFVENIAS